MGATNINKAAQALINALRNATMTQPDVVPDGWLTAEQIGKHLGMCAGHVKRKLRLVPRETKKFRIKTAKRVMLVVHYRLK